MPFYWAKSSTTMSNAMRAADSSSDEDDDDRKPAAKRRRSTDGLDDNDEDEEESIFVGVPATQRRSPHRQGVVPARSTTPCSNRRRVLADRCEEDDVALVREAEGEVDPSENLAFCCLECRCSPEHIAQYVENPEQLWIRSGTGAAYHRRCCHGVAVVEETWLSPLQAAVEQVSTSVLQQPTGYTYENFFQSTIEERASREFGPADRFANDAGTAHPVDTLRTDPLYRPRVLQPFQACVEARQSNPPSCVLLEAFGGIGTGSLVLKRLGLDITKAIYVDHDPVAKHVYRENHDREYNPALPVDAEMEHVYFDKFQEISDDAFDAFYDEHGPIDVVLAGPPCVDFTPVNARRGGINGQYGSLMQMLCTFLFRLMDRQGADRPVFFLIENVPLHDDNDVDTLADFFDNIGVKRIVLESASFSPCYRKREYHTNIPIDKLQFDHGQLPLPYTCLDDGCNTALGVTSTLPPSETFTRLNTFMASVYRINNETVYVYKKHPTEDSVIMGRPVTVVERCRIMGFPDDYITDPLDRLFAGLLNAHIHFELSHMEHNTILDPPVDEKYLIFAGQPANFQCLGPLETDDIRNHIALKLLPPDAKQFHVKDAYAKRLIGNAWNVPTVMNLLERLTEVFAHKTFQGYDYGFVWLEEPSDAEADED